MSKRTTTNEKQTRALGAGVEKKKHHDMIAFDEPLHISHPIRNPLLVAVGVRFKARFL